MHHAVFTRVEYLALLAEEETRLHIRRADLSEIVTPAAAASALAPWRARHNPDLVNFSRAAF